MVRDFARTVIGHVADGNAARRASRYVDMICADSRLNDDPQPRQLLDIGRAELVSAAAVHDSFDVRAIGARYSVSTRIDGDEVGVRPDDLTLDIEIVAELRIHDCNLH